MASLVLGLESEDAKKIASGLSALKTDEIRQLDKVLALAAEFVRQFRSQNLCVCGKRRSISPREKLGSFGCNITIRCRSE